jgi:hypothetical protein
MKNVSISKGNSKMGAISSISLPACATCNSAAPCFKLCYAAKISRLYKTVDSAYKRNLDILNNDPEEYFNAVRSAAKLQRFFRWHVSGDIPSLDYFVQMVKIANDLPGTQFLAFTKQYNIVNTYLNSGGTIPANLKILFSNWGAWKCENPYNLPTCEVIFKGTTPEENWQICGGNCTECACNGSGCWSLKNGETIATYQH